uniref:Uncharacterized protein n=1 Tax=Oryza barthii TaxID=65489 RepID=A0A0D3F3V8_9ORYZ
MAPPQPQPPPPPPKYSCHLFLSQRQPRCSNLEAVGDVTAVPEDYTENMPSSSGSTNVATSISSHEDNLAGRVAKTNQTSKENQKMIKISDKLIGVFMVDKPTPTDWRKLLSFSREWDNIRPHFFKRCQERADAESNPEMKHNLLRLARKLKEIDEDVQRHNELLEVVKSTPSDEIGSVIAKRRKDFTVEFFNHLYYVAESYHDDPEKQRELAQLGNDCVDALQAHDDTSGSLEALSAAELKLKDILNSPSVDAACRKIDDLAEKKELDSALVLMLSKAWSAAKGTDITKSEAKDIMFHLYMAAVANLQRQMPKDIRILKHLIMIEDPEERLSALNDAFTPGPELQGDNVDTLYTIMLESIATALQKDIHLAFALPLPEQAHQEMLHMQFMDFNYSPISEYDKWAYTWGNDRYSSQKVYARNFMFTQQIPHLQWIWKAKCTMKIKSVCLATPS